MNGKTTKLIDSQIYKIANVNIADSNYIIQLFWGITETSKSIKKTA